MKKTSIILFSVLCIVSFGISFAYNTSDEANAEFLADKWIIVRHPGGSFLYRLDDTITRAEVIGMALKIKWITLPNDYTCKNYFSDVKYDAKNNWICRAVELAADNWLVTRANLKFRPQDKITKVEALAIMLSTKSTVIIKNIGLSEGYGYHDSDWNDPKDWQDDVMETARIGRVIAPSFIIQKYSTGLSSYEYLWDFNKSSTRAEVFAFTKKIIENSINENKYVWTFSADFWNDFSGMDDREGIVRFWFWENVVGEGIDNYRYSIVVLPKEKAYLWVWDKFAWTGLYKWKTYYMFNYMGMCWGQFLVFFTDDKVVRISSFCEEDTNTIVNQLNKINFEINTWYRLANNLDVLSIYYQLLDTWNLTNAYSFRSPAWVSEATFYSWYKNVTAVDFREETLKDLGYELDSSKHIYEFFVDMTENGVKSTYKVQSIVDLENFKINNISSVKQ
jgi:hypothetical protein